MKNKIFKPWLHTVVFMAALVLFMALISIDDFNMESTPLIICGWLVLAELVYVLKKHTRGGIVPEIKKEDSLLGKIFLG